MVSIFTSPRKLVIETKVDAQILLHKFRERVIESNIISQFKSSFSVGGQYLGKIESRHVEVEYKSAMSNLLQPKMHIQVETNQNNGSVISTRYTTNIVAKVFLIYWMTMASFASMTILFTYSARWLSLMFPVVGVLLIAACRLIARRDENKMEWLVKDVVATAEAEQRGEKYASVSCGAPATFVPI